MKDRTGTTLCAGCRTYRVDAWFVNVKGKQCRSCAICRGSSPHKKGDIDCIAANITRPQFTGPGVTTESLMQYALDILAQDQQKYVAKAERKAARKAAERQQLAPPATDDKEVAA